MIGENGKTTLFTDAKGHLVTIPIPYGTYVVIESVTPHNMETVKPFEVKITENHPTNPQIWRVFIDREFTAKLRVIKKMCIRDRVNTSATTGTFTSNSGKVEVNGSCVFWLTGDSKDQEFVSEVPSGDPLPAYIKVKTENIGYGEITKTDEALSLIHI